MPPKTLKKKLMNQAKKDRVVKKRGEMLAKVEKKIQTSIIKQAEANEKKETHKNKAVEKRVAEIEQTYEILNAVELDKFQSEIEEAVVESIMIDNINKARASMGISPINPV